MSTTQNNKIIAEFMGYIKHTQTKAYLTTDGYFHEKDLKFHSDWNWLMEVVDKCSQTSEDLNVTSLFMADCWMFHTKDILSVYNACVEFIKWYNLNK